MKKTPRQEIDALLTSLPSGGVFMLGTRDQEVRYTLHNRDRYRHTLATLDEALVSFPERLAILDIGTSPFTFILRRRYPQASIHTIDYTSAFKDRCRKNHIVFHQVDLAQSRLPAFRKRFHIVTFLEVIEHVAGDHKKILAFIAQVLKPGGLCIIQTPNRQAVKSMLRQAIPKTLWLLFSQEASETEEFKHVKEYAASELMTLVSSLPVFRVVRFDRPLYYDSISSSLVYRKSTLITLPFLFIHFVLTTLFPPLRVGMEAVLQKR